MAYRLVEPFRGPSGGSASGRGDELRGFMNSLSHEMRTPLTSIGGYVELLLDGDGGELSPDQRDYVRVVARNARRLTRLLDDLTALEELEGGHEPERTTVEVGRLLREVVDDQQADATEAGVEIVLRVPAGTPVVGEEVALRRAVAHLIANAVRHSPSGGQVLIEAGSDGHELVVSVRDHGVGIPAADLPRLGQRFFRASTTVEDRGSGLGLAIARAVAARHGGRLEVESEEGHGSTFRICLPFRGPELSAGADPRAGVERPELNLR